MKRLDRQHSSLGVQLVPNGFRSYRAWQLNNRDIQFTLAAMNGTPWLPGKRLEATCRKTYTLVGPNLPHVAPHPGCTCGIYSRYDPNDLVDILGNFNPGNHIYMYGSVILSGMIDHGERGSQAQYAQIESLCYATTLNPVYNGNPTVPGIRARDVLKIIAGRYKVPLFNTMDELAHEFRPENLDFLDEMKKVQDKKDEEEIEHIKSLATVLDITPEQAIKIVNDYAHGQVIPARKGGKTAAQGTYVNGTGIVWTPNFPNHSTSVTYSAADQALIMRQMYGYNS